MYIKVFYPFVPSVLSPNNDLSTKNVKRGFI
jgi:hypothetical protein